MTCFLRLYTAPSIEPVSLAEAKAQCQQDGTHDDTLISRLITAARTYVETETGRALITQTWEAVFGEWPRTQEIASEADDFSFYPTLVPASVASDYIEIVKMPFGSVTEITVAGEAWTAFTAVKTARGVRIKPTSGAPDGEVVARFTAGYGAAAVNVPSDLSHAILMLVATLYDNRGAAMVTPKDMAIAAQAVPGFADTLHRYRVMT